MSDFVIWCLNMIVISSVGRPATLDLVLHFPADQIGDNNACCKFCSTRRAAPPA
jgi:hypothetical protein